MGRAEQNKINGRKGGRPKGKKDPHTLEREAVAAAIRQQILEKAAPLIRAAMIPAMGQNFIYRIDEQKNEKGRVVHKEHVLVTSPSEIQMALDQIEEGASHPDDKFYYVSTTAPDFRAVQMLLDRALGKSKESLELSNPDGNLKTIIINKNVKK